MGTKETNELAGGGAAPAHPHAPVQRHRQAPIHGTVLIADDEEHIVRFVTRVLRQLGLHVLAANNGRRAVELFAQHVEEIDCVLLDVVMPHLSGEEVLRHVRMRRPDLPAIIMSGSVEQEVRARFALWRGVSILHKPFGLELLETYVRAAISLNGCPAR